MARNPLQCYLWLLDTLRRYGSLTRDRINELWLASPLSDGEELQRRTLFNYRQKIQEVLGIKIEVDPTTYEYYLDMPNGQAGEITEWLLNTTAVNNMLGNVADLSDRIFLEDVPSARRFLAPVIASLRENRLLTFTYHPYTRVLPTKGVVIEPYFLKIFRQRWYVTGLNSKDGRIKTYALDRMEDVTVADTTFTPDPTFDLGAYVADTFGIVFSQGEAYTVALRADARQAKYLRALPLHASQQEAVHDDYSIFYYRLRLTPDFVQELLSLGPRVTVISPPELRAMVVSQLKETLKLYQ